MEKLLFATSPDHGFFRIAFFTALLVLLLILISGYVKPGTCSQWPMCYQSLLPPVTKTQVLHVVSQQPQATGETLRAIRFAMSERYLIILLTLINIFLFLQSLFLYSTSTVKPAFVCIINLVLVGFLIFLNKQLSTHYQALWIIANSLVQISLLCSLWWLCRITDPFPIPPPTTPANLRVRPWLWIGFGLLLLQLVSGKLVNVYGAAYVCQDFPYCHGNLMPHLDFSHWKSLLHFSHPDMAMLLGLNIIHRIISFLVAGYLAGLSFVLFFNHYIFQSAFLIFLLLCAQCVFGVLDLNSAYPFIASLGHHLLGYALLLALLSLLAYLYKSRETFW